MNEERQTSHTTTHLLRILLGVVCAIVSLNAFAWSKQTHIHRSDSIASDTLSAYVTASDSASVALDEDEPVAEDAYLPKEHYQRMNAQRDAYRAKHGKKDSQSDDDEGEVDAESVVGENMARLQRPMTAIDSLACDTLVHTPVFTFNPEPSRAVWLSALFPGLGQIYNRRYWKLPIVVGGFMGITYALTWNNRMLTDYSQAYRDATDSDPNTKSYMDFFPKNTKESDLDMTYVTNLLKTRKDFYRRNRDLSIICMVGMYLLCMLDAYVDASLSHFDVTPDLSMDITPTMLGTSAEGKPNIGVQWSINF